MPQYIVADLIGPLLDYAIALTGREWERAYLYTKTEGLLSAYGGAALLVVHGERYCVLTSAQPGGKPFRFSPSSDGRAGVALQQAERCDVWYEEEDEWMARCNDFDGNWTGDDATADEPLIAICRAVLISRVGEGVELSTTAIDSPPE